jgi:hypothetical protein
MVDFRVGEVKTVRNRLRVDPPFFDQRANVAYGYSPVPNVGLVVNLRLITRNDGVQLLRHN